MRRDNNLNSVRLGVKQKLIYQILKDEFAGTAFGPEMLDKSEALEKEQLSIQSITMTFKTLYEMGIVKKEKKAYRGRILNEYSLTEPFMYDVIDIK